MMAACATLPGRNWGKVMANPLLHHIGSGEDRVKVLVQMMHHELLSAFSLECRTAM